MLRPLTTACVLALTWSLALSGCAAFGDNSSGAPSTGFPNAAVRDAYVPLESHALGLFQHWGAAVMVAPNVAATNAHNRIMVPDGAVLAVSRDYDLLFFRTGRTTPARMAQAQPGEVVVAYGQGSEKDLRQAQGAVRAINVHVAPRCADCVGQQAIVYDAGAGPGFSGGPLVDAATGAVVGITFGFRDSDDDESHPRQMYAYSMDLVLSEMHRLLGENGPNS